MRRSPLIFVAVSILAVSALAYAIAVGVVARIESETRQQAVTALAAAGQNWASADPLGMRLVLTGEAPDDAAKFEALEVLGRVIDGTRIDDLTSVKSSDPETLPDFRLEILRTENDVALIGLVPVSDADLPLTDAVANVVGQEVKTDLLDQTAGAVPEHWTKAVDFALQLLPLIDQGNLKVSPGRVDVVALAASDASRTKLEADLMALQPDDVTLSLEVKSPMPIVSPFRFAMSLHDGTVTFAECSAETNEGRARIISAVKRAGAVDLPNCNLAIGSPSPAWPQAIDLAITGLEELGGGNLQFSDAEILLTALPDSDPVKLEQVRADLQSTLPQMFTLTTVLPETNDGNVEVYQPLFSATLHTDGSMSMTGGLPDDASRAAVGTYASSLLALGQVQNRAKVDPKLPDGWTARVLAGIETLALLNSGTLTVSSEKLYIEGRGVSPDINAEVNDVLASQLGEGQAFSTLVVTDPSLSKEVVPPANTECAAQVSEILAKQQISFAPNSGKIAEVSSAVIDDIAIVLKNCATASFEIGGHTDSQGGEVLNQALSQTRADAVLDALLARDVLIAHMSARGYGESQPIGDNETEDGRAKNRRIAFKLLESRDEQN